MHWQPEKPPTGEAASASQLSLEDSSGPVSVAAKNEDIGSAEKQTGPAYNAQSRQIAAVFWSRFPGMMLMIIRLMMEPLRMLQSGKMAMSGAEWERGRQGLLPKRSSEETSLTRGNTRRPL